MENKLGNYEWCHMLTENFMNFGLQTVLTKTGVFTHPRKGCVLLHCQVEHTEFSERNSSKLYQTVGSKSREQRYIFFTYVQIG